MSAPRWFAAYVRSRHEARIAKHFEDRAIEFFFPQYRSERLWSDRKVELLLPLFPGYMFVRIAREHGSGVLETPGVIYLVGARAPEPLEDCEIDRLKNISANERTLKPLPEPLLAVNVGDRVRVTRGPLQGYVGFLARTKKNRVVLVQDLLRQAMSVEVEMDAIVIIGKPQAPRTEAREHRAAENGRRSAAARTDAVSLNFENPRANADGGPREPEEGLSAGEGAESALARECAPHGDPLRADGAGGLAPRG